MQGGVATDFIKWREDDGIGRTVRNGLNFTERGFGIRGAVGNPDRGNTAASQLKPGDIDWDHIFGKLGVRWFHTGGIFAALSDTTAELTVEAVKAAQQARHDRQLRSQLPPVALENHRRPEEGAGGQPRDRQVRRRHDRQRGGLHRLARLRGQGRDRGFTHIETDAFKAMIETAVKGVPELQGRRHHAAPRPHRDRQRLERDPLARRQFHESDESRTSRSSTASAAATRSPPACSSASSSSEPEGRRVRRRPRRPRLDHPRRHLHGVQGRGAQARCGRRCSGRPLAPRGSVEEASGIALPHTVTDNRSAIRPAPRSSRKCRAGGGAKSGAK